MWNDEALKAQLVIWEFMKPIATILLSLLIIFIFASIDKKISNVYLKALYWFVLGTLLGYLLGYSVGLS